MKSLCYTLLYKAESNSRNRLTKEMHVGGECILQLAPCGTELCEQLAKDIAAEVVLLATNLYKPCPPEQVRCVVGCCCILYRNAGCGMQVGTELAVIAILETETVLHPLGLYLLPVGPLHAPELGLVLCLLAGIDARALEEVVLEPVVGLGAIYTGHVIEYLELAEREVTIAEVVGGVALGHQGHVVELVEGGALLGDEGDTLLGGVEPELLKLGKLGLALWDEGLNICDYS